VFWGTKHPVIVLKSDFEIDKMRSAGRLAAETLAMIEKHIRPGISTLELNDICHDFTVSRGAVCAPLNYRGYPKSICTSVNDVVCHGIPNSKQVLKDGDIINVDVTPILDGYHGDASKTFFVGTNVSAAARKLVKVTEECLEIGISQIRVGARIGDIGYAIQEHAEKHGYSVVRDFVGHGIGKVFHEDPQVPHYGEAGKGVRIEPGMTFTVEPMINAGDYRCKILKDKWTAVTVDRSLSAQFEHTIAIRSNGTVEILTLP
jgi:methionyl aminopeptidase